MSSIYRNGQFYGQTSNPINDAETSLTQTWSSEFIAKFVGDNVDAIVEEIDSLEYSGLAPEIQNNGTVYFITDRGVIYHNGIEYGKGLVTKEDLEDYSTKEETETLVSEKVAEIVADAPEDFDTLKEMSDWLTSHEESAAAMNSAINNKLDNTTTYALSDSVGGSALKAVADENGENIAGNFSSIKSTIGDIQTVLATVVEVNEEGV